MVERQSRDHAVEISPDMPLLLGLSPLGDIERPAQRRMPGTALSYVRAGVPSQ
jgi:hypothetical protein